MLRRRGVYTHMYAPQQGADHVGEITGELKQANTKNTNQQMHRSQLEELHNITS